MGPVQGPAHLPGVPHGGQGRPGRLLRRGAGVLQGGGVVGQVVHQLRRRLGAGRAVADVPAHRRAPGGEISPLHQAMAGAAPERTALTAAVKVRHSFFCASSARSPFPVMR